MHGFPLMFHRIAKQMHKGKKKYATEQEAMNCKGIQSAYLCPFYCMFHGSSHKSKPRYDQERWWIIWHKELENA